MSLSRAASVTLRLVAGALFVVSIFLPPGHPQTHAALIEADLAGALDSAAEGDRDHACYFGLRAAALCSPVLFGLLVALGAFGSRAASRVSAFLHTLGLLPLAALLWMLCALEDRSDWAKIYGAGGVLLGLLLVAQLWIAGRLLGRPSAWRDAGQLIPLVLLLVIGLAGAISQRGNDQWHVLDYVVMVCASALGLTAIAWSARE